MFFHFILESRAVGAQQLLQQPANNHKLNIPARDTHTDKAEILHFANVPPPPPPPSPPAIAVIFSNTLFRFESLELLLFSCRELESGPTQTLPRKRKRPWKAPAASLLEILWPTRLCLTAKILCGEGWAGKVCTEGRDELS